LTANPTASRPLPVIGLLVLGAGIAGIFYHIGRLPELKSQTPEVIAWLLAAGLLYVVAAFLVERFGLGRWALVVILGAALAFRLFALPLSPSLSTDVYRYEWEGRVQRAGINPYTTYPAALRPLGLEDPEHPLEVGPFTPTLYPPLSEWSFSWAKTVPGYKRLYTGLDVASIFLLLLLLGVRKQPLARVLMYAWNPTVVVAFAMCGHHDSLAILALLAANLLIIAERWAASIALLAFSFLAKFFAAPLLPVFLKRTRWRYAGIFAGVVVAGYLPYASAGRKLLDGLSQYAAGWENNDSVFRLLLLAGNSKAQAGLIAGVLFTALLLFVLKRRLEPLQATFVLVAGLLVLSPNAFPWYFTWLIPFLCFYLSPPWLLVSVTCALGYAPVILFAAGQPYKDSPLMLALEYVPVFAWLAWELGRDSLFGLPSPESRNPNAPCQT
jgi:alpha-1,6-mannosyltransferase